MGSRKVLPTLQQIITNHLNDVDYMALNLQNLVIEDAMRTTVPIHHKTFNLASKISTTKHQFVKTPTAFRSVKRTQSLKKTINYINFPIASTVPNTCKNQQFQAKTDTNDDALQQSSVSQNNKSPSKYKNNRKTLSRFLFQFQIPVSKTSPHKGLKTLAVPVDKIHTLQTNFEMKQKNKSESMFKKTYITQPLNIESKPISVQSKKIKTMCTEQDYDKRAKSCYIKMKNRRQKTQYNQYLFELKPWVIPDCQQM